MREILAEEGAQHSQFKGRIICMSMYNDICWKQNMNEKVCRQDAMRVPSFAEDFEPGRWSHLGRGNEVKWYGSLIGKTMREDGALQRRF